MTPGAALAAAIGQQLAEWADDGYWPPPACGEPYSQAPQFGCIRPAGHDGPHGYNGPPCEETR